MTGKKDNKKQDAVNQQPMDDSQRPLANALSSYLKTLPQDRFFRYLKKYLNDTNDGPSSQEHMEIIKIVCGSTKTPMPQDAIEILFNELNSFACIVNPPPQYIDTIQTIFYKLNQIVTDEKDKHRLLLAACSYLIKSKDTFNSAQNAAVKTIRDYIVRL